MNGADWIRGAEWILLFLAQVVPPALREEEFGLLRIHAHVSGESLRAFTGEEDVRAVLHDVPGQADRMPHLAK